MLTRDEVDVLIVGGGIVGAGVARDAAMRGLRTLLVEQNDFASGTSSRSSRLLHGGLRYLAQGRVGLVREASLEKVRLRTIAPHLCDPLPFLFPTRRHTPWQPWKLTAGTWLYDVLCGGRNLGRSSSLGKAEMLRRLPGLDDTRLTGGVRYFDALTNDARLVIDTLRSAERHGARLRNYTGPAAVDRANDGWECNLEGRIVAARVVVNASGAWASRLPHSRVRLRLTKGVHLVIERSRLPVPEAVVLAEGDRILFVIPWGERVILGTTDTDYAGDPGAVRTDPEDVEYILRVVNAGFPRIHLAREDVIATWAGVRPLIAPVHIQKAAPSDISRSHQIRMTEPGWFDIAGGKLTTYRLMAEQAVDKIGGYLRLRLPASQTVREPLLDGVDFCASGVLPPEFREEVVAHCCRAEWARHLDDVMMRRTSWHFYYGMRADLAERCSHWMAQELGWSEALRAEEMERYLDMAGMSAGNPTHRRTT